MVALTRNLGVWLCARDSKYPPCPAPPARGGLSDLQYVIRGFEAAPLLDGPFEYITYWHGLPLHRTPCT